MQKVANFCCSIPNPCIPAGSSHYHKRTHYTLSLCTYCSENHNNTCEESTKIVFVCILIESDWLKWWNDVGIFQVTSTTTAGPPVTSKWNWSFNVATDDQQTQANGTSNNTYFFTVIGRRLTAEALACHY